MLATVLVLFALLSFGQEPSRRQQQAPQPTPSPQAAASPAAPTTQARRPTEQPSPSPSPEEPPTVTHHEIKVGGKTIRYTATAGLMPIKNRDGEVEARMFFVSYTLDDAGAINRRPLTFSFNGGP